MKLISYVLFGPRHFYSRCIPYHFLARDVLLPEYRIRYYIHDDVSGGPGATFLGALDPAADDFEIVRMSRPYRNLEPALYRMRPIWDAAPPEILLVRDADSIPTLLEARAARSLETSAFRAQTFRNHADKMWLAGLSAFKCAEMRPPLPDSYVAFAARAESLPAAASWRYGSDEAVMNSWLSAEFATAFQVRTRIFPRTRRVRLNEPHVIPAETVTRLGMTAALIDRLSVHAGEIVSGDPDTLFRLLASPDIRSAAPIARALALDHRLRTFYAGGLWR